MNKYECEECSRGFNVIEKLEDHDCPMHLSAQTELLEKIKELEEKLADCQKGVRNAAEINRLLANRNDDLKQQVIDYETDWRKMRKYYDGAMEKVNEMEKELELKDSWVKHHQACVEIAMKKRREAVEKLEETEKALKEACEVIGFYAETDNWLEEKDRNNLYTIIMNDASDDFDDLLRFGGKRAREFLKKIKDPRSVQEKFNDIANGRD